MSPHVIEPEGRRSVLGRVFEILDCFALDEAEQTIGSLCKRTGLPPATVHRLLAHLVEWDAVERTSRGRYRLGMRLWRLGRGVPDARLLRDVARPFMVDLHRAVGELVTLGSRDGDDVILADVIGGLAANSGPRPQRRMALPDSAPGLVLLAFSPVDSLNRDLARILDQRADTPSDDFRLRQTLSEIRRSAVAVSHAPSSGGLAWVAAPIFDCDGAIRSTLAVAVPEPRLNAVPLSHAVASAARAISHELARSEQIVPIDRFAAPRPASA